MKTLWPALRHVRNDSLLRGAAKPESESEYYISTTSAHRTPGLLFHISFLALLFLFILSMTGQTSAAQVTGLMSCF